jgi:cytosine/adenosine deaminase-related metal-dependent hydrolase
LPRLLTADWVLPIAGPAIERGVVVIDGETIIGVHPKGYATADTDFGAAAILPGLVNAHTHLDLSGARGLIPPSPDFTGWLDRVIDYRRARANEDVVADIKAGIAECERFGVTLIGDISAESHSSSPLATSSLRATIFHEIIGLSPNRFDEQLAIAVSRIEQRSERFRYTRSPHAPYSVNHPRLLALLAQRQGLAIHLAESAAEIELLAHQTGPFVDFLNRKNLWQPDAITASLPELVAACERHVIIHGNFIDPATLTANHTLVYCPRTHAAFGHPSYPLREFLATGATIALGTDSLASNPDLDILGEARFVRERYPDLDARSILAMVTINGARALRFDHLVGTIEVGKRADLTIVRLANGHADPHEAALLGPAAGKRMTFVSGYVRWASWP